MSDKPTLVFIPGAWHKPACYDKVLKPLRDQHNIKCIAVTLPSTTGNPNSTFKDDYNAARDPILSELGSGCNVIVIAHSYGGIVGNSVIKGLTLPKPHDKSSTVSTQQRVGSSYVLGLILIASGFAITGFAFMDPLFGKPPPFWRINKETGYAEITADPRQLFYHDLPDDEAQYWVSQLTTHSLKSLFEGGEYTYAGWADVPTWYIGGSEDQGLPVVVQRIQVEVVRAQGATVYHTELETSHSPFLSRPDDVVEVILEAIDITAMSKAPASKSDQPIVRKSIGLVDPGPRLTAPATWLRFGFTFIFGRILGWTFIVATRLRKFWRR